MLNIESIYCAWSLEVYSPVTNLGTGVYDVHHAAIFAESDVIGAVETIGHGSDISNEWVEAENLIWKVGLWTSTVLPSIDRIGEVYFSRCGHGDVVGRIKGELP